MPTKNETITDAQKRALYCARKGRTFTVKDLARLARLTTQQAGIHVNSLCRLGAVEMLETGGPGKAAVYRRVN